MHLVLRLRGGGGPPEEPPVTDSFSVIVEYEGTDHTLTVDNKNVIISTLKSKLEHETRVKSDLQELYLGSVLLSNEKKMTDCGVGDKTRIRMVRKPGVSYIEVVAAQDVKGFWPGMERVTGMLGLTAVPPVPAEILGKENAAEIWTTLLVLGWLEVRRADSKEEWKMVSKKALKWLQRQGLDVKSLLATVSQVVAAA